MGSRAGCTGRVRAILAGAGVLLRLRRRTEARSRNGEKLTVFIVIALGVVIAPTLLGEGIDDFVGQLASGVTDSSR